MNIDTEPLYVPIKLKLLRKRLEREVQKKRWVEMTLKPQKKGLFSSLISFFTKS